MDKTNPQPFTLPKLATAKVLNVRVQRVGVQVHVTIGNNDTWKFKWKDALTLGWKWWEEARAALKEGRAAEMYYNHHKMYTGAKHLLLIARRVITDGVEAKALDSCTKIVEVGPNALQK